MNEEQIIIDKKTVLEQFDKAGDPMAMWCILRAFGKEAPSEEVVRALYEDAKRTHHSVHTLTDLAFQSAIQIRLLRKLFPWLEPSSIMIINDKKE
jgi:hypothetical protein